MNFKRLHTESSSAIPVEWHLNTYSLDDRRVHTAWMTVECIQPEWSSNVYFLSQLISYILSDLEMCTLSMIFDCIPTEEPSSAYSLSDDVEHTFWDKIRPLTISVKTNVYCLSDLSEHTAWVTSKFIPAEWPPSAYTLNGFEVYTHYLISNSYILSHFAPHTCYMTLSYASPFLKQDLTWNRWTPTSLPSRGYWPSPMSATKRR